MLTLFRLVYPMNTIASKHQLIRKLDLGSLELFVQICQSGSLAAVSANAHLAISSISKRIKELETLLATPLLIRKARGVEPTEAGLCLLKHAKTVVLSVEQLRVDLQDFSLGRNEYVRIFASASVVEQYLAAEIAEFAKKFPDISIDLAQLSSREVIQAVQEGQADIGLFGRHSNFNGWSGGDTKVDNITSAKQQRIADQITDSLACRARIASYDNFWPFFQRVHSAFFFFPQNERGKGHGKCREVFRSQAFADNSPYP